MIIEIGSQVIVGHMCSPDGEDRDDLVPANSFGVCVQLRSESNYRNINASVT